ncbi:hypothetical protein LIER_25539 [Lithospermum erythrorhizon]|uniref:Uncharacterized protein n=1 Tax=Lithospermum erythrorhizon TaxID=34254 RepID=A0AAV3R543_LITER
MHETTEKLNALLYSDDESNDDEETSTGHSPSYMTIPRVEDWLKSRGEEVVSSAGTTKRQKLLNRGYDKPLAVTDAVLTDTASSMKCVAFPETEDDTEPSCGNAVNQLPKNSVLSRERNDLGKRTYMRQFEFSKNLKSIAKDIGLVAF